jgi:hypothetical protein
MAEIRIQESRKSKLKWKDIPKFKDSYRWPVVQVQEHEVAFTLSFPVIPNTLQILTLPLKITGNIRLWRYSISSSI